MRWLWLVALLLLPYAAGQSSGQFEACRPPVLAVQQPARPFDPGSATSLLMAIENPNGAPIDSVLASITTTAPAGWTAIPGQRELTLGPKDVDTIGMAVTAPNRGSGSSEGNVTVLVTFVCTDGDIQTSASASEVLEVSLLAFEAPWPLVLGAFAVLAGGVTVLGVRRLRRSTALIPLGEERSVAPGHNVKFTFLVENRRGKPQRLRLEARGVPAGWTIHIALRDVELEPGEEKTLWAILKAPPLAQIGSEVQFTLHLFAERGVEVATGALHAKVVSP